MNSISDRDIDWLALEGCEAVGYLPGQTAAYDLAGFDRIMRQDVAPGTYRTRDFARPDRGVSPPSRAEFLNEPYLTRIGGFRREKLFSPDEIGAIVRGYGIAWNDGLGNGMFESLLIDRKYGLHASFELPVFGFDVPFTESEWSAFREFYPEHVAKVLGHLAELNAVYRDELLRRESIVCVLFCLETPLSLFAKALRRNPREVCEELDAATGRGLPVVAPSTTEDRAALAKFWAFIRRKHSDALEFQSQTIRAALGDRARIVGNSHELPPVDLDGFGRTYDYPGVAVRPALLTDELMLRHYVPFCVQWVRDLSGRAPMASIRVNLLAAGCRFIPSDNLIRHWYEQAIRHGAGGFYFYARDYPSSLADHPYDGPIPGNPDLSTSPDVRWKASLEMLAEVGASKRLALPPAEMAILAATHSALLHRVEWRRIYAAFSACAESRIHTCFVSDGRIENEGVPSGTKIVLAPVLEFVSPAMKEGLENFTASGGVLIVPDRPLCDLNGKHAVTISGAERTDREAFDVFPLDEEGSRETLARLADLIQRRVAQGDIDKLSWVFDISLDDLRPVDVSPLRKADPEIRFDTWMYEHSSDWILPYVEKDPGHEKEVER